VSSGNQMLEEAIENLSNNFIPGVVSEAEKRLTN
jgi:hypothetical protein